MALKPGDLLSRLKLDKESIMSRFNTKGGDNLDDTEFRRLIEITAKVYDEDTESEVNEVRKVLRIVTKGNGTRKNSVTLVPMKSLSLEDFAFPFSNATKIREALRLQVMPYSAAGNLEIFPVVLSKAGIGKKGVNGVVWYLSPDELDVPSMPYDSGNSNKVWPAALPFISQLKDYDGTGVTMWIDEQNICSMLWQNNKPVLSRWRKLSTLHTEEKELAWYDNYCKAREIERGGSFVINVSGDDNDDSEAGLEFSRIINESIKICPWIKDVNLSRRAIEGAMDLERNVRLLTRVSCWLLALGVVTLGSSFIKWQQTQTQLAEARTRSESFYRKVFDPSHTGRISNPVSLARDKIAALTGTGPAGHQVDEVLADIGEIFTNNQSMDITLDIIRYNSEGLDCNGTAPDMSTILTFRKAWEGRASIAQVDNTQFVSGIGYRFDLRIRW
ncbi:MAG: hypothetical protein II917_10565 [Synergistaceae bacterium]|nr:hypothetical protein [Synergistaceae bacterium]